MPKHTVKQGDCLATIALEFGFLCDTIWDDPANAELKEKRKSPNLLHPGDEVTIPDIEPKEETVELGKKHRFRFKGVTKETLKVRLLDGLDQPRADLPYTLVIDGVEIQGTTDQDGVLEEKIPLTAREGKLLLGDDKDEEVELAIGHLDPANEVSGAQARLAHMGFDVGPADDDHGPRTRGAIEEFQLAYDLESTGELDEPTQAKLEEIYGA